MPRRPFPFPLLVTIIFLLFLLVFAPLTTASFDFVVRPEFGERSGDLNVTTFAGQTAHLPCTVKHLAGKRVSWIRGRDLQVLSTGRVTFSTDVRISVLPGSNKFKSRKTRSAHACLEDVEEEEGGRRVEEMALNSSSGPSPSSTTATEEGEEKEEARKRQEVEGEGGLKQFSVSVPSLSSDVTTSSSSHGNMRRVQPHPNAAHPYRSKVTPPSYTYFRSNTLTLYPHDSHRTPLHLNPLTSPQPHGSQHARPQPPHTPGHTPTQNHHRHPTTYTITPQHTHHHPPYHHHLHHHHHALETQPPRRRRALNWPSWSADYFYYPYHDDEDTISGLGGSPSWFHRELARFNNEGRRSYGDHQNPIAIYPQGPLSHDSQGKGHVPGPNYIEGVWEPEDYTLQIKFTKPEDVGTYICQINTEPRITQVVHLNVVNMRAEIVGSRELYVKAGTPVTLACKVNHGKLMPGFILWYKGDRLVEYDTSGGRITVSTEPTGVSHLLLRNARPGDSANYTCSPSAGAPASLILNVIVDERQAAMQQGNSAPPHPSPHHHLLPPTLALLWGIGGGAVERVGGVGVLLMVGEVLFPTQIPLLPLFLFLLTVLCILPVFRLQKRGKFK